MATQVDVTAFLLARGADPLRPRNGVTVTAEAEIRGHWLGRRNHAGLERADNSETRTVTGRNH